MYSKQLNTHGLKAVVFDWDNTLAQSRDTLVSSINPVLAHYGLPQWSIVCHRRNNELSFRDNFPLIFGSDAERAYDEYRQIYLTNVASQIKPFPYVAETLAYFNARHIPMMIMTNKDRRLIDVELPLLFDPNLFSRIVCGHEAEHDKPYRAHLLQTLEGIVRSSEISPNSVWVVGDSPLDSRCAINAGARAIRIGTSLWPEDQDADISDILFFDSFIDFYKALPQN